MGRRQPENTTVFSALKTRLKTHSPRSAFLAFPALFSLAKVLSLSFYFYPWMGMLLTWPPSDFPVVTVGEAREKLAKRRADGFFEGNTSFGVTSSSSLASKTVTSETADARGPQGPLKRRD